MSGGQHTDASRRMYEDAARQQMGGGMVSNQSVRKEPEGVNLQIEQLLDNALSFRQYGIDPVQPTTLQKAHDAIAVMVRRELTTRHTRITDLLGHVALLDRELVQAWNINEREAESHKATVDGWRKACDQKAEQLQQVEGVINRISDVLFEDHEGCGSPDELPDVLVRLFEQIVERGLGAGMLDICGSDHDNDPLWMKLARITQRDPETGNRLPQDEQENVGIGGTEND